MDSRKGSSSSTTEINTSCAIADSKEASSAPMPAPANASRLQARMSAKARHLAMPGTLSHGLRPRLFALEHQPKSRFQYMGPRNSLTRDGDSKKNSSRVG